MSIANICKWLFFLSFFTNAFSPFQQEKQMKSKEQKVNFFGNYCLFNINRKIPGTLRSLPSCLNKLFLPTFMIWWTGATRRSVSCSFLHLGSLLHHWNKELVKHRLYGSWVPFQTLRTHDVVSVFPGSSEHWYNWEHIDEKLLKPKLLLNFVQKY